MFLDRNGAPLGDELTEQQAEEAQLDALKELNVLPDVPNQGHYRRMEDYARRTAEASEKTVELLTGFLAEVAKLSTLADGMLNPDGSPNMGAVSKMIPGVPSWVGKLL